MNSNIGHIISLAASNEDDAASQIYLWCLSKIDMQKVVERAVIARRTPTEVKAVIIEYTCKAIHYMIKKYDVCSMISRVFQNTTVYVRRKPTAHGLSKTHFQVVMKWNEYSEFQPRRLEPYHETLMQKTFAYEEMTRDLQRRSQDPSIDDEMLLDIQEHIADLAQMNAQDLRSTF